MRSRLSTGGNCFFSQTDLIDRKKKDSDLPLPISSYCRTGGTGARHQSTKHQPTIQDRRGCADHLGESLVHTVLLAFGTSIQAVMRWCMHQRLPSRKKQEEPFISTVLSARLAQGHKVKSLFVYMKPQPVCSLSSLLSPFFPTPSFSFLLPLFGHLFQVLVKDDIQIIDRYNCIIDFFVSTVHRLLQSSYASLAQPLFIEGGMWGDGLDH